MRGFSTLTVFSSGRRAFTLVELLTVVAIIGILSAITIPAINGAIRHARLATCVGNLRAIGAGMLLYANEHNGCLPGHGATGGSETGSGQRWYNKTAPYMGLGLEEKVVAASAATDGTTVLVCGDAGTARVFHCTEVDPRYYEGANPINGALGLYRSNLNVITRSTNGLSVEQIAYPAQTMVLADTYCGTDLSDPKNVVGGPNMSTNAPPYPQNSGGPCANHRADGNPSADPLGAGQCPMLFADGHAEAVELSDLRPWSDCTASGVRPKTITVVAQ